MGAAAVTAVLSDESGRLEAEDLFVGGGGSLHNFTQIQITRPSPAAFAPQGKSLLLNRGGARVESLCLTGPSLFRGRNKRGIVSVMKPDAILVP